MPRSCLAFIALRDQPQHLLERPRTGIVVGRTQFRAQRIVTTEDAQRQEAVLAIVPLEEAAELMPISAPDLCPQRPPCLLAV